MTGLFKPAKAQTISPAEASERLKRGEIHLIDVREANEWAQMHIPGAIHMPLSNFPALVDQLPAGKPVVFHCLSGKRSARALEICQEHGKPHDTHIAGGITAWRAAGLPVKP
ncbi:MAG: rhodanese-like domain-containing protein [Hyphomicrobium sp.]